jgi:alpha-amylase
VTIGIIRTALGVYSTLLLSNLSQSHRWVRVGDKWHDGCAVVICNGDEGQKWMDVGQKHAGEVWTDVLGWHQGKVEINSDGWGEFKCPARSVSIWTAKGARGRDEFGTKK